MPKVGSSNLFKSNVLKWYTYSSSSFSTVFFNMIGSLILKFFNLLLFWGLVLDFITLNITSERFFFGFSNIDFFKLSQASLSLVKNCAIPKNL